MEAYFFLACNKNFFKNIKLADPASCEHSKIGKYKSIIKLNLNVHDYELYSEKCSHKSFTVPRINLTLDDDLKESSFS